MPSFHKINCLSKPYSLDEQKKKIFDYKKRINRECFALKLAILNQDDATFKYLWNGSRLLWNFGHLLVCLSKMVRNQWDSGIKLFLGSPTSKVIFMSINDTESYVEALVKFN